MAYYMYLRKSRKDMEAEQRGEGETLARHFRVLTELAARMGIAIPPENIYKEIVSGDTIAARPEMQKMLARIQTGECDGVFVMEIERLARGDTIDQGIVAQTFKYTNTKIITPVKTYDPNDPFDEEYFEFNLFMSRREFSAIKRRLNTGRVTAVKEGKFVANKTPYGYGRKKAENGRGYLLVPNHEAAVVRNIFDWYVNGYNGKRLGTTKIAHMLNELGIPARSGGPWTTATIQSILHHPVYIGKLRWNRRKGKKRLENGEVKITRPLNDDCLIVNGLHEPLISEEIWEKAQNILRSNRPSPVPAGKETQNPFAGLLVCGKCGRKMVRRPYKSRQEPTILCSFPECSNVSSALSLVERKLVKTVEVFFKGMTASEPFTPQEPIMEREALVATDAEIDAARKQQDKIRTLLEQDVYTIDVYRERNEAINDTLRKLRDRKAQLEKALSAYEERKTQLEATLRTQSVWEAYWDAAPAKRNEMLKAIIEKIVYTREAGTRLVDRENFELQVFWRI